MGDRHQFRAQWHDYDDGLYFVTICSLQKTHIFGHIQAGTMHLTTLGKIVEECINKISEYHKDAEVWNYVVMPNHVHLVVAVGTRLIASAQQPDQQKNMGCLSPPRHGDATHNYHHNSRLSVIIGAFKAGVTRSARTRRIASLPCWQPRFHENIIRSRRAYEFIMDYIDHNVENWDKDCFAK